MEFLHFPDIESFYNVVKYAKVYYRGGPVSYRGKMKQHGTNAAVRISDGEVGAQSRTQLITPESDNAGFARWVWGCKDYWKSLSQSGECTVYGEWCGPGIMKGTAINQIPKKVFAVFAVMVGKTEGGQFIFDPQEIENFLGERPDDVHVLPWHTGVFEVDFSSEFSMRKSVAEFNKIVEEVEPCDPWVKQVFGVEGTAEGLVYYPHFTAREDFRNFVFKTKGEKHRVVKAKEAAQIDPEMAGNIGEFATMFVTEARCEQGLNAVGGSSEMKNMGPFLKWINQDIIKESSAELEASGLEWKQVNKAVNEAARNWFASKNKEI